MAAWTAQLRKGLVELGVFGVLRCGEAYGYQIVQELRASAGLDLTESTVYPVLARLANEGWVTVRVGPSPAGPPRRYYRLTAAGKQRLQAMAAEWRVTARAIDRLLEGV